MSRRTSKAVDQYLNQYSLGVDYSSKLSEHNWKNVLVVPVCGEEADFLSHLFSEVETDSPLVIVIVNRPDEHAETAQWKTSNQQLINHLQAQAGSHIELSDGHDLLLACLGVDVLLLNFNEQPFSAKHGVGMARKIAADSALHLIVEQIVSAPWIFSTDADVQLPVNYFECINQVTDQTAAICLDFEHVTSDSQLQQLQEQYDFKLHYYQQAMRFIGCPYTYTPLGSTLIIKADAYAKVRGFPKRSGGEDFYLLNKLAKIGSVAQPKAPIVKINARQSTRVPFGTGPAINDIQQINESGRDVLHYHPSIFHSIKAWRQGLIDYYVTHALPVNDHGLNEYWQVETTFEKAIKQTNSEQRWLQFIDEWLDAFRLLKSVHFLREQMPSVPYLELVAMPDYWEVVGEGD